MRVTITKLRQNLFKLAGKALEFVYKGIVFRILPESKPRKLANLVGQKVMASGTSLRQANRKLLREMEAGLGKGLG